MRAIKFRAWNGKKMYVPDYVSGDGRGEFEHLEYEGTCFVESTLMQFTGLHDKNGKEIYEGDVVSFPDTESTYEDVGIGEVKVAEYPLNSFYPVHFVDGGFGFKVTRESEALEQRWYWLAEVLFNEGLTLEVIGNIYSNPELLQK